MYRYLVVSAEPLSPTTLLLTLRPSDSVRHPMGYYPGQYAAISFKHNQRVSPARCFSLTSSPHDGSFIQFGIRVGGRFTTKLQTVTPGDDVYVRGPFGGFIINSATHNEPIFVAGGVGIAPYMSMLRFAAATHDSRPMTLLYGVRSQDDIPFHDEIQRLKSELPNLKVVYAVGSGDTDKLGQQTVISGRLDTALLQQAINGHSKAKTVYICGPPPVMQAMVRASKELGIPQDQIVTEAFRQGPHRQTGKVVSWPRNMYALGAIGVTLGMLALLVADIIKSLPLTPLKKDSEARYQLHGDSTERDRNLDRLVNEFAAKVEAGKSLSPSAVAAIDAAKIPETIIVQSGPVPTNTSGGTYVAPTPTNPSTPATTPAPTAPKCTTTQSGVTTCN